MVGNYCYNRENIMELLKENIYGVLETFINGGCDKVVAETL
jgi:hypothetical protein